MISLERRLQLGLVLSIAGFTLVFLLLLFLYEEFAAAFAILMMPLIATAAAMCGADMPYLSSRSLR